MALYTISSTTASTSTPMTAQLMPKKIRQAWQQLALAYYRYEVTYGLYTMDYTEKVIVNLLVFLTFSLLVAACLFYLPGLVVRSAASISWYWLGEQPNLHWQLTNLVSATAQEARLAMVTAAFGNNTYRGDL